MRWELKAAAQKFFSVAPGGERMNHLMQVHVTKTLPASDRQLELHVSEAAVQSAHFERLGSVAPGDARAYEFGAGWDLVGPIAMWMLGYNSQTLVDIEDLLRVELAEDTRRRLAAMHDSLEELTGRELRRLPDTPLRATADLGTAFGIDYRAPCDARATPFADASFDFISSTFTLEHIPEPDIAGILTECRRLLAPGAVLTASVDMQDHYSFSDPRISIYNFLRFSDRRWALINSALHYQNRLRACDYDRLFRQAGLPVTERTDTEPAPDQAAALDALPLADRFRTRYDRSELLAPAVTLVSVV